ncbi:hypothetical protein [Streptomyces sp. NPDC005435]|uniref:hypothetical protein n=1 Tax=Streptomyces sp. NPDC005435 TaxID=3154464 RepID=UPI003452AAF7
MRGNGAVGTATRLPSALLLTLAGLLFVTGCQSEAPSAEVRPSSAPPAHTGTFLAKGECSSFGPTSFTEVPCSGERAGARVVARYDGPVTEGPPCPPATDFVLHIGGGLPATGRTTAPAVPRGYACMRNLQPPHPGDPGRGGGPRTVPGDCVYDSGDGQVRETPCDGSGPHPPSYKVTDTVPARPACPPSTSLYVQVGGPNPVGCARRL